MNLSNRLLQELLNQLVFLLPHMLVVFLVASALLWGFLRNRDAPMHGIGCLLAIVGGFIGGFTGGVVGLLYGAFLIPLLVACAVDVIFGLPRTDAPARTAQQTPGAVEAIDQGKQ